MYKRLLLVVCLATLGILPMSSGASNVGVVLSGNAVGSVHFDENQDTAIGGLEKLLGTPRGGVRSAKGNCTIDAALYWTNFAAYFLHGKFVGYQTGNNLTGTVVPAFDGVTPKGLRVGDTLAMAERLYGKALTTRGENGGVYAAATKVGTLRGYLSAEVSSPPSKIKIQTISAGSVGCPAASPG